MDQYNSFNNNWCHYVDPSGPNPRKRKRKLLIPMWTKIIKPSSISSTKKSFKARSVQSMPRPRPNPTHAVISDDTTVGSNTTYSNKGFKAVSWFSLTGSSNSFRGNKRVKTITGHVLELITILSLAALLPTAIAVEFSTCKTTGIAVSNVTNCVGSTCVANYALTGTGVLSENFRTCLVLNELKDPTPGSNATMIPAQNITIETMNVGTDIPLQLVKVGAHLKITWNAYCEGSIFASAVHDCSKAPILGNYSFSTCFVVSQYQKDAIPHGNRKVAINVGISAEPRFYHFKTSTPVPDISLGFAIDPDESFTSWNGYTPLDLVVNSETTISISNANYNKVTSIGSDLILDAWVPYDLYEVSDINNLGEFNPYKYDSVYFDQNGVLKFDLNKLQQLFTFKLMKCADENTRVSVNFNYPDLDVPLENYRLDKRSIKNKYPAARYYDENLYRLNDLFASSQTFSHNIENPKSLYEYSKLGGSSASQFITVTTSYGYFPMKIGYMNGACVFGLGDAPLAPAAWADYKIYNGTSLENSSFIYLSCDPNTLKWKYSYDDSTWVVASPVTILTSYGKVITLDLNSFPYNFSFSFPQTGRHLHISTNTPGSYLYTLTAKRSGSFFSATVCPELEYVRDNADNRTLTISARSTCGNGAVIMTVSNNLFADTVSIHLTSSFNQFLVPRTSNVSGLFTIGLCAQTCDYKMVRAKSFPTSNYTIFDDQLDGEQNNTSSETFDWLNPDSWFDFSGFGNWSLTSKLKKIGQLIALILIGIIILFVLFFLGKMILPKLWNMKSKQRTLKAKYF